MSDTPRTDAIEALFGDMPGEMRKLEGQRDADFEKPRAKRITEGRE